MELTGVPRRIARAQELMSERDLDFLFVAPSSDMIYMFDGPSHASERLALVMIPRDGKPQVVAPQLEYSRFADKADIAQIHTWPETAQPVDLVAELLSGVDRPRVAVSDTMWSVFLVRMLEAIPDAQWSSATPIIRELRMVKDESEIEKLRVAGAAADRAWDEFATTASIIGKTEREAAMILTELRRKHGLDVTGIGICASGPNGANPHHSTGDRILQEGDAVVFDFGGTIDNYHADVTRTAHLGEPSDEYRKVYEIVLRANRVALGEFRLGNTCQDVDRAARKVITDAGYGEYFIHRVGHGLGLDGHEEPYLVEGNDLPLQVGMVFSDEPGVYLPGKFGIRVEDAVAVRESGGELLNHCNRELTVMS